MLVVVLPHWLLTRPADALCSTPQSNWRVDDVLERVRKGSLELGDDMSSLADVVDGRGDHSPPRGSASPQTQGSEPSEPRRSGEPLHQSAASARRRAPSASAAPTRLTSASSATSAVSSSDERLTFPPRSNSPVSSLESGAREVQSLPETVLPCPRRVVEVYDSQLAQQRHAQNASGAAARSPSGESPLCTLLSGDVARPQSTRSGEEDGQSLGAASFGTAEPRLLSFTGEVGGNSTPSSPGDGAAGGPGWSGEDGLSSSSSSNTSFYTVVQSRSGKQDTESPGGSPVVTLTARSRSAQRVAQTPPPTNAPDPDSSDEIVLTSTHGTRPAQCGAAPALFRGRRHTTSSATSRAMPQPCLFPSPPARDASPLADGVMPFGAGIQGGETGVGAGLQLPNLVSTPSMASVVASLPVLPTGVAMPASASSGVSVLPPAPRTPSQPVEGTSPLPAPAQSPALPLAPLMGPVTGFARPRAATHRLCQWRRPPHGTWVREVCPESGITSPARQAGATLRALPGLSASVLVVGPEAGKASWALKLGHECGAAGSAGPPPPSGVPLRDAVAQAVAAARGSGAGREGAPSPSSASAAAQRSPHARARGVGALLGAAHCTLTRVAVVDVPWLDGPGATQIGLADCGAGEGWAGSFASHALRKSDIVVLLATVPDEAGRPVEAALHASQRLALALVRACSESSRRASLPLPPLVMGVLAPAGATKLLVTGSGRELNPLWDVTTLETSCADAGAAALVRSISSDPGEIQSTVEDFGRVMDQLVSIWCNALCVDDSVINARLLHRHAISCFGVSPTVASNGEEAIAAAHSKLDAHGPFRLVFMDIDLGAGINGREAAARIRQLPHPSSLTARREATRAPRFSAHSIIVAVTGNATKQEQDACKKEMDDFLAKPVPVARFRDILRASFTGPAPAAPRSPQERS